MQDPVNQAALRSEKGTAPPPPPSPLPCSVPSSVRRLPCYSPELSPRLLSCIMRLTTGSHNIKITHFNVLRFQCRYLLPIHDWNSRNETESNVLCNSSRCFARTCFTNEFGDVYSVCDPQFGRLHCQKLSHSR